MKCRECKYLVEYIDSSGNHDGISCIIDKDCHEVIYGDIDCEYGEGE